MVHHPTRDELFDRVESIVVTAERAAQMKVAGELDHARVWDALGHVTGQRNLHEAIVAAVEDEGRRVDGRERFTDVDGDVAQHDLLHDSRGRCLSFVARDESPSLFVFRQV